MRATNKIMCDIFHKVMLYKRLADIMLMVMYIDRNGAPLVISAFSSLALIIPFYFDDVHRPSIKPPFTAFFPLNSLKILSVVHPNAAFILFRVYHRVRHSVMLKSYQRRSIIIFE